MNGDGKTDGSDIVETISALETSLRQLEQHYNMFLTALTPGLL